MRVESRNLLLCNRVPNLRTLWLPNVVLFLSDPIQSMSSLIQSMPALRCPGITRVCLLTAEPSYIDALDVVLESEEAAGTRMPFCPVQH